MVPSDLDLVVLRVSLAVREDGLASSAGGGGEEAIIALAAGGVFVANGAVGEEGVAEHA